MARKKKTTTDKINEVLDAEYIEIEDECKELTELDQDLGSNLPVPIDNQQQIDEDFEIARKAMHNSLAVAQKLIDDLAVFAEASEAINSYGALGELLTTTNQLAKDLLEIHQQKQTLDTIGNLGSNIKSGGDTHIEQAIFVGSTKDLLERIKTEKEAIEGECKEIKPDG